jgi:hypothetical protein
MIQKLADKDLELFNRQLIDYYGQTDDKPNWRLVWSPDVYEKRLVSHTREGLQLLRPELMEVRKYQYPEARYILEKLTVVPMFVETDLVEQLSYEPIWTFEKYNDKKNLEFVLPNFAACRFVIEQVCEQIRVGHYAKYKDPESNPKEEKEIREARIDGLVSELFGDESSITDALSVRQGVAYGPGSSPNSSTPSIKGL